MTQASADRIPYQKPQPWGMSPDMVIPDLMGGDPQLGAPVGDGVWWRMRVTGGRMWREWMEGRRSRRMDWGRRRRLR